ncbi:MAG: DUF2520 domain-containing protein [Deltaproteobacteria bacterium]|nr:DUF2520 domain-containing protein [Deltaproteobacteria bacterium]
MTTGAREAKIGFIGAGVVGTALAFHLGERGYAVIGASSLHLPAARRLAGRVRGARAFAGAQELASRADLVFVTTPDDAIPEVVKHIRWRKTQGVVHCSGARSLDILEPARQAGARVGSFHPLQTFAGVEQAIADLPGSTFALEAKEPLRAQLKGMAEALQGRWIVLRAGDKVLYHTGAVLASNYVVTLIKMATDLWGHFGVPPVEAARELLPLLRGTVRNIEAVGLPDCLTGPIARGDIGTLRRHLQGLQGKAPSLVRAYGELGLQTIPIALAKGKIDSGRAKEMERVFRVQGRAKRKRKACGSRRLRK